MTLFEWTMWVTSTGVSLVALTFAISQYFNVRRRPKKKVLMRGLVVGIGISVVFYIFGVIFFVELEPISGSMLPDERLNLPPYIELLREFPYHKEFPPDNKPLIKPVTERYIWVNNGGPVYHTELHILDLLNVTAGPCGELGNFEKRTIPILNPSHYSSRLMDDQVELPFFVPWDSESSLTLLNIAIHGVEFDAKENALDHYIQAFDVYIDTLTGICGHIRRSAIIAKFIYLDVQGVEHSLFYRFGLVDPFETLREEVWISVLDNIPDTEFQDGYDLKELADPCRVMNFLKGGSLTQACT